MPGAETGRYGPGMDSSELPPRVRAVTDLDLPAARESAGLHGYDGEVPDLSPSAVNAALERLGRGEAPTDPLDAAHLAAAEAALVTRFRAAREHRRNPLVHLDALDLSCYDRDYAPAAQRQHARRRHLDGWPQAIDTAIRYLDDVPAALASALLPAARGLAHGVDDDAALRAHRRLTGHLQAVARSGDPDPALGGETLAALLGSAEALTVDLTTLTRDAETEAIRQHEALRAATHQLAPGRPLRGVVAELLADHPRTPAEIYAEARALVGEATAFTIERGLLPDPGGACTVGPAPASRSWAMAMLAWAGPHEPDGPSQYWVTPPDPSWTPEEQEEWLMVFSRTTLPAITVHEVTPGHFAHGRFLRRTATAVRSTLFSYAFIEGWAHYAEELMVEAGFRADDPRFAAGVALEALVRTTRLRVALGLHTGDLTLDDAAALFTEEAFLAGPAARSEAARATFDPTYGRYTWGKLAILAAREQARAQWGSRFSLQRFHRALLERGSPPLGLLPAIITAAGE